MRILLDSNLLISFLLKPQADSAVVQVISAVVAGRCELLLPRELIDEVRQVAQSRKHLRTRISLDDFDELLDLLSPQAVAAPPIPGELPALTRDPKDDYLLACAVIGQADYLITGDADLLVLDEVEGVKIVSARQFWEVLSVR